MQEIYGDAWDLFKVFDILCITTNGFVKNDGSCVMGRGIAAAAKGMFPGIEYHLGSLIRKNGNIVQEILVNKNSTKRILAFPVKHNWYEKAEIALIQKSCRELGEWKDYTILLPRPGCGNGQLSWIDVKPAIINLLGDNVSVVHYKKEE